MKFETEREDKPMRKIMEKITERLMRKYFLVPNADIKYINCVADSMSDAESMRDFMFRCGIIKGDPENWEVWTPDGNSFVIETYAVRKDLVPVFDEEMITESFVPEDFFDVDPDEVIFHF